MSTISKKTKDKMSRSFSKKVLVLAFEEFEIQRIWKCPHCSDIQIGHDILEPGITHHCGKCGEPVFKVVDEVEEED